MKRGIVLAAAALGLFAGNTLERRQLEMQTAINSR
jgi:hypothetical protein